MAPGRGRTLPSKVKSSAKQPFTGDRDLLCVLGDWMAVAEHWMAVWMRHTPLPLP
jgi:hypothetical protein